MPSEVGNLKISWMRRAGWADAEDAGLTTARPSLVCGASLGEGMVTSLTSIVRVWAAIRRLTSHMPARHGMATNGRTD